MRTSLPCLILLSVALAACQPDAQSQYPDSGEPAAAPADAAVPAGPAADAINNEVAADAPIHDAVITAANLRLSEQLGQTVAIQPEIFRSEGVWAFVYGPVRNLDGSAIDWSATNFAAAHAEGMMDGDLGVVLLNWTSDAWTVTESVIGATDVPQAGWPAAHGVSPALVGMEGS